MRHPRKRIGRGSVCLIEKMEGRQLLAGNVTATIVGGVLTIKGDSKANEIQVDSNDDFTTTVTGVGTTINGNPLPATFPGPPPISIDMGDGDDVVTLSDMQFQSVTVTTGKGNDYVLGVNRDVADNLFNRLTINTGDGDDYIRLGGSTGVAVDLNIDTGKGNDMVESVGSLGVGGNVKISTGADNDSVRFAGSAFIGGSLSADGGDGGFDVLNKSAASVSVGGSTSFTNFEVLFL